MEEIINLFNYIQGYFSKFWNFKLFTVEEDNIISIGDLVVGVILLIFLYKVSKKVSQLLAQKFLSKLQWDSSTRLVIEKVVFYFLLALSVLFVLSVLLVLYRVPLVTSIGTLYRRVDSLSDMRHA